MPATKTKKKKKTKKTPAGFKNRGGTKFNVVLNDNKLHDIIREEMTGMGGRHAMKGDTNPFDLIDTYRCALFFMWGIPLDAPIDKEFKKEALKALRRLKKEEPDLYAEWKAKHDARMKTG